jgi:O-antigen/teichoic acid export membrane protein
LVLPAWLGLKAAGALKALANLAMPAGHAITSLGLLALPILIRHREEGGLVKMRQTVRHVGRLFFAGAVLYLVVLWVFRVQIIHFLYGGRYLEYSGLPVFLAGLVPLGSACAVTFGTALRAYERPDRVFWSNFVGSLLTLSLGLWLAATRGPGGALAGWLASYVAFAATSWFFYRKQGSESASA